MPRPDTLVTLAAVEKPVSPAGETPHLTLEAAEKSHPERTKKRDEPNGLLNLGASLTERAEYEAAEIAYRQVLNGKHAGETEIKSALLGQAHHFAQKLRRHRWRFNRSRFFENTE